MSRWPHFIASSKPIPAAVWSTVGNLKWWPAHNDAGGWKSLFCPGRKELKQTYGRTRTNRPTQLQRIPTSNHKCLKLMLHHNHQHPLSLVRFDAHKSQKFVWLWALIDLAVKRPKIKMSVWTLQTESHSNHLIVYFKGVPVWWCHFK